MNDKIIKLFDNLERGEVLPIQRSAIFERLAGIPKDIADEYVSAINRYIEDVLIWRSIISSIGQPQLCEFLIENLDAEKLEKLDKIISCLASKVPEQRITDLLSLSFNIVTATPEIKEKASQVIDLFKSLDTNDLVEGYRFGRLSIRAGIIADIFTLLHDNNPDFEEVLLSRLHRIDEAELDYLIELVKDMLSDSKKII
jgi:hypothetical protein